MAFANTKKRPDILAAQLFTKRISNMFRSYRQGAEDDCALIEKCTSDCSCQDFDVICALDQSVNVLRNGRTVEQILELINNLQFQNSYLVWTENNFKTLFVKYSWEDDINRISVNRKQTFHSMTISSRAVRMDGVRYTVAGMECVGIIDKIFQMRQNKC